MGFQNYVNIAVAYAFAVLSKAYALNALVLLREHKTRYIYKKRKNELK